MHSELTDERLPTISRSQLKIDLSGKVVLVTGGARGIGAAVARAVVHAGASVVIHDITMANENLVKADLGEDRVAFVCGDLSDPTVVPALWERALAWRGYIDVLVNNAGVYESAEVAGSFDHWRSSWERTLNINLVAAANFCREAIRHFLARGGGRIINIASRAGFRGDGPDYSNYAASKGALLALTRTIARGYAADNILAYAVAPGFVRTQLNDEFFRRYGEGVAIAETPLGQIAEPADVANVVAFLASDLGRHATGATIDVNGASYVR